MLGIDSERNLLKEVLEQQRLELNLGWAHLRMVRMLMLGIDLVQMPEEEVLEQESLELSFGWAAS